MSRAADQFADSVIAAGLLSAGEVGALLSGMPEEARPRDGEALARLLVERGTLTEFQCRELLSGSGTPLVLGDYVLLSRIGAGGMGQVFMARHLRMKRLVAVKLLPAALSGDAAMIQRFEREVEAAAKLSHPNIVQAFDAGVERGVWYLAMEHVEGSDLAGLVAREGSLPVERVVDYVRQAARGLAYAHENGVIHRDIKPANLLLDKRGTVKILDMGLARLDDAQAATGELTQSGQVMGTVDYMAPEQALDTHAVDARADIYSLGCTMFRLLTGKNLYDAATLTRKLMAHQTSPVPPLTAICPHAPPSLAAVFERMVAKRPEDRFQTMAEVDAALARLAGAQPSCEIVPAQRAMRADSEIISPSGSLAVTMLTPVEPADGDGALSQTLSYASGLVGTDAVSDGSIQAARQGDKPGPGANRPLWRRPGTLAVAGVAATLLASLVTWKAAHNDARPVAGSGGSTGSGMQVSPEAASAPSADSGDAPPASEPEPLVELLTSPEFIWTAPETLGPAVNSREVDSNPRLSDDGLRLWFLAGTEVLMSRRKSATAPWEPAAPIDPPLGSLSRGYDLFVSADERRLCLVRWHHPNDPFVAYELSRTGPQEAWSIPRLMRGEADSTQFPVLSADGLALYFCTGVTGLNGHKIHATTRPNLDAPWSPAVRLDALNSDRQDRPGWISPDGRVLLLFSTREMPDNWQYRLWLATRASPESNWQPPVHFGPQPVDGAIDQTPCLSRDGRTLIFSSNRPGNRKSDLYMSRLVPKDSLPQSPSPGLVEEAVDEPVDEPSPFVELLTSRDFVWTAPENLGPAVNSPDVDINPRLSDDGLRLWFLTGPNNDQPVLSRRESENSPWEPAAPIDPPLGSVKGAWDLFVSGDERRMCFVPIRPVNGTFTAVELSRSGLNDRWSPPQTLRGETLRTQFPVLSADGLTLYFATILPGFSNHKISVATRPKLDAPWSPAVGLDVLHSNGLDRPAWISPDGRALLFFSTRGMPDNSKYRLWLTTRASTAGGWKPPVRFGPDSEPLATDETPCLSSDGKTLIFCSDRPGSREKDLYVSRLVPKAAPQPTSPENSHEGIDLLALVDLPRDNVITSSFGEWTREGQTLISPGNNREGRIAVPFRPPAEYELTAVVERVAGNDGVVFGIVVAGRPVRVDFDCFIPQASGMSRVDGQWGNGNETTFQGKVLADRNLHTIRIAVRQRSVQASVDDLEVIHWEGDPARLSCLEPIPNLQNVWFGAAFHQFKFHRLLLKPLSAAE